ncbi:glycine-rich RNA-binding protein 4, mitochondrial-like [Humulus lupulus]|uniref:glycine-rich RNA-binding protein 4, mitochondrial-like n=1 Tax=Humulus lupulus TaxID=3486 RepID=UPI002B408C13|nr:glycine-rich RNA-binding protein 4, mitochondrial-like [Humulus lupulus]
MSNTLMSFLCRRAPSTTIPILQHPVSFWRSYCSPPSSSSNASNKKLFVGGLSWSVDEKSLSDAFSSFGEVTEVKIIYDKDSGRSRGFGFVQYLKEDDALSAKDAMDGKALLGRPLRISVAVDKARGGPVVVPRLSNTAIGAGNDA